MSVLLIPGLFKIFFRDDRDRIADAVQFRFGRVHGKHDLAQLEDGLRRRHGREKQGERQGRRQIEFHMSPLRAIRPVWFKRDVLEGGTHPSRER